MNFRIELCIMIMFNVNIVSTYNILALVNGKEETLQIQYPENLTMNGKSVNGTLNY